MPIPLFLIPSHISISIIQKFDLADFVNFRQCSLKSFNASIKVKTRFAIEEPAEYKRDGTKYDVRMILFLKYINEKIVISFQISNNSHSGIPFSDDLCSYPVRFENCLAGVCGQFTEEFCISLLNFVQQTNSSMELIAFSKINCSPKSLQQLAETQKVGRFVTRKLLHRTYMRIDAIKNALVDEKKRIECVNIGTVKTLHTDDIFHGIPIASKSGDTTCIGRKIIYSVTIEDYHVTISKVPPTEQNNDD